LPSTTQGGSPVRKLRPPGSVRGVLGDRYSYRDRRRVVLIAAGGWLANTFPLAGRAQTKDQPIVIGWIEAGSPETSASALGWFREGLSALGLKEGAQIVLEQGWLHGRSDRIETVARKLAENKPAVIVTSPRTITVAVAKSLPKIPLV
jgi:ABC-type uncharacterized transport system substrate-binding protein